MLLSHDEILYHEYGIELFLKTALEGIRTRFVLRHGSRDGNVGWLHLPRLKYFNLRMDCHDTHDPQWMNPSDLGDLLAFLLAQACQHFFFQVSCEISQPSTGRISAISDFVPRL